MAEGRRKKSKKNIFEREASVLAEIRVKLEASEEEESPNYKDDLLELADHYEELIDQSKLITKVSDRLQKKINNANDALAQKNDELQETIDALTKAKVGRKAATITLIIFVLIFLVVEGTLEPFIDNNLKNWAKSVHILENNTFLVGLGLKLVLALFIRPIELIVNKTLMNRAAKEVAEKRAAALENGTK